MKKEWLIGGMIGFITTFTIILVDSLTTWPYIVQLLLALILGVLMTVAVHKLVQSNKNIYRTIRYVQIVLGFTLLLALTLNFFEVIHVPDNILSVGIILLVVLLIVTWVMDKKYQEDAREES